jgi:hypothetical protein
MDSQSAIPHTPHPSDRNSYDKSTIEQRDSCMMRCFTNYPG